MGGGGMRLSGAALCFLFRLLHCILYSPYYFFKRATWSTFSALSISALWCGWHTFAHRGDPTSRMYGLQWWVAMEY